MKKVIFIITIILSYNTYAQSAEEVFERYINAKKTNTEYQVSINYALYNGKSGKMAYESYNGIQAKYNEVFYQKLKRTEFVLGKNFMVKLNPDEKAMLVGYSSSNIIDNPNSIDNSKILKAFEDKKLEDVKDYWKLTLSKPKDSSILEFSVVELYIDKKTFNLNKQVVFYNYIADFSVYKATQNSLPQKGNPRLDIIYTNYKDTISLDKKKFKRSHYFTYEKEKIFPSESYGDYEIIFAN